MFPKARLKGFTLRKPFPVPRFTEITQTPHNLARERRRPPKAENSPVSSLNALVAEGHENFHHRYVFARKRISIQRKRTGIAPGEGRGRGTPGTSVCLLYGLARLKSGKFQTKRPEKKKPLVEEGPVALAACPTSKHQYQQLKRPCSSPHRWLATPRLVLTLPHSEITELPSRVRGIRNPLVSPIP